jgi:hypothetical protein
MTNLRNPNGALLTGIHLAKSLNAELTAVSVRENLWVHRCRGVGCDYAAASAAANYYRNL